MKRDIELLVLIGLGGFLAWMMGTRKGQAFTQAAASAAATGAEVIVSTIRGERNNNPGNIRHGPSKWQGMSPEQTDPAFVQFTDPVYGIRALARLLVNYGTQGANTVERIINRWAPPSENVTSSYVSHVARLAQVDARQQLDMRDPATLSKLAAAIITHENGRNIYEAALIDRAVNMALT